MDNLTIIQERLIEELSLSLYDNKTMEDGYAFLNSPIQTIVNTGPRTITLDDLLLMLSQDSLSKLIDWPMIGDLRDKVMSQDILGVIKWLGAIRGIKITNEEFDLAYQYLTATQSIETSIPITPRVCNIIKAIPGGPNYITEAQFNSAWQIVRGQ